MSEVYEISDGKRSKYLLCLSIVFTALFFIVFLFGHELCRSGFPLTFFVIGTPILGALAAFVSLFNPKSSISVVMGKLLVIVVNLCFLGMAGVALTGMRIAQCGWLGRSEKRSIFRPTRCFTNRNRQTCYVL